VPMNHRLLVPRKTPGLLDLVPGAAAAYSLRSLSRSYAGPVVTVRRSSDDAEDSFTAAEVADGTLAAFCGAADGLVKQWWDQSGNARHAAQLTNNNQPIIVDDGVLNLQDGKPAISFDGTSNRLQTSVNLGTANSFFVVATPSSTTNAYLIRSNGSAGSPAIISNFSSLSLEFYTSAERETLLDSGDSLTAIGVVQEDGGMLFGTLNGATAFNTTSSLSGTDSLQVTVIGSSGTANYFAGNMLEVLIYTKNAYSQHQLATGNQMWYY